MDTAARVLAEYFQTKHNIILNIVCKGGRGWRAGYAGRGQGQARRIHLRLPRHSPFLHCGHLKKTGYSLKDFRTVVQITNMWMSLAVNADSDIKDIRGLMEAAKANPGKVNYATHGAYSTQSLFMRRILKTFPGVDLPHITYASGQEVSTALLGRHVTSGFGVTTNQKPYVLSGDFRMIGGDQSGTAAREFPDVPTFAEQAGPEYVFGSPHGLLAPPART